MTGRTVNHSRLFGKDETENYLFIYSQLVVVTKGKTFTNIEKITKHWKTDFTIHTFKRNKDESIFT